MRSVKKTHDIQVGDGKISIKKSHSSSGGPSSPFTMSSKFKVKTKGKYGKSKLSKDKDKESK